MGCVCVFVEVFVEDLVPEDVLVKVLDPEGVLVEDLVLEGVLVEVLVPEGVLVEVLDPEGVLVEVGVLVREVVGEFECDTREVLDAVRVFVLDAEEEWELDGGRRSTTTCTWVRKSLASTSYVYTPFGVDEDTCT